MVFRELDSPVGILQLVANQTHIREIRFSRSAQGRASSPPSEEGSPLIDELVSQLGAYFEGQLQTFDLPLDPVGTDFQKNVWQALLRIPYATTISYGEIAARIERPAASRAVGAANGQNPIPIIVPCHRVIGSDGSLTGYGGGLDIKKILLELEGWSQPTQMTLV